MFVGVTSQELWQPYSEATLMDMGKIRQYQNTIITTTTTTTTSSNNNNNNNNNNQQQQQQQ